MPASAVAARAAAAALLAAATLLLAGCGTPPVTRLYTLLPADDGAAVPATSPTTLAPTAAAIPVRLQVAGLPAQVDQAQWLVRNPDGSLALLEQERWAAPLRDELRGALLQALLAGYGVVDAVVASGGDARGPAGPPRDAKAGAAAQPVPWRVTVDVTRFDSLPGRAARLDASWSLAPPDPAVALLACRSTFSEAVGGDAPALAEGHRRNVAALAGEIGRALQAGGTACPKAAAP